MTKPSEKSKVVRKLRCAVYTRKSSEEGLEQEFNSLHAQREACEAYIASQRSEGWVLVRDQYDDGGISGGTLERPGLKRLLEDIEDGLVDVVVVYKIDRLSRSLADFAKLVEVFDRNGVTFVSVTQSFNTTTSMGRLTLNILLSFAQFEREVTAERIRDKVAASRKKGMWMGGVPPYGYRVENRKLVVDEEAAAHVRWIFAHFLEIGSGTELAREITKRGIRTPRGNRIDKKYIYRMLSNRAYIGEAVHKGDSYPGEHDAIIDRETWDRVHAILQESPRKRAARKSAMLGVAREAWEAAGYEVRGVVLSGIAAENLESGSGIASRTIASMEHGWEQGRDMLTSRDVLVIDEAGMVGTRQLERVLSHAAEAGAKVVLVGDPQQLQSIEAGAAFRSIHERHGGAEIGEVRRQREDWQRDATRDLATGKTGNAIHAYDRHGMVHIAETREQARGDLIERWDRERQANPDATRIILTHTNDEVRALNEAARQKMRDAGNLGDEVRVTVERGERHFAAGDRVMFLQNERGLGVKNGTLGTIEQVSEKSLTVRADDGRSVAFDLKDYNKIDHGYAATIHKAQGMTVDRTHVLATPGMDAHGSYVALSRHRDGTDLHYGRDDFADQNRLVRSLSRDRAKDMATDYDPAQAYAERRGITFRERVVEIVRKIVPEKVRGMFDGLRLPADAAPGDNAVPSPQRAAPEKTVAADPEVALRKARAGALVRHARASNAIIETKQQGLAPSAEQRRELGEARRAFDEVRPHGWQDAEAAYSKDNGLAREAGGGRIGRAIRALQLETEIRTGRNADPGITPSARADRFVERWQNLSQNSQRQYAAGDYSGYKAARSQMGDMANSLQRDPQLESLLAGRRKDLGIGGDFDTGMGIGKDLALSHGLGLGRGIGL